MTRCRVLLWGCLLSAACGGSGAPDIEVVERWTAGAPSLTIGSVDGPDALTEVTALRVGPDGLIYAAFQTEGLIKVFGPEGALLRTVGRSGEGPGEFQRPARLGFFGDTLWVSDTRLRRTSLYTLDGELLDDRSWPEAPGDPDEGIGGAHQGHAAGGASLFQTSASPVSELMGSEHPFPLVTVSPDGEVLDTLGTLNLQHASALVMRTSGGQIQAVSIFRQLFSDVSLSAVAPNGERVVILDRAIPESSEALGYRWVEVDLHGDTLRGGVRTTEPIPITVSRTDSIVEAWVNPGASADEIREALFLPSVHPAASALVVGSDGTVWVGREEVPDQPRMWDVFGANGSLVAEIELPERFTVHVADRGRVLGVLLDELDVPYIVEYPVGPSTTGDEDGS